MDIVVEAGWRGLTRRQAQVVSLIVSGMSVAEAARHLSLTADTIKSHLRRAYRCTGTSGRLELRNLLVEDHHGSRRLKVTIDDIAWFLAVETLTGPRTRFQAVTAIRGEWRRNQKLRASYHDRAVRLVNYLGVAPRPTASDLQQ